ncbi:hypothetical protein AM588_10011148 [Phytophthora nicotianae]|uniref:Presenilin n=1 Tax=Phytophthora nicotianae TaxID=4792 RepID=A0A0W8DSP2_PHYNI|nr:hypothetical protein AM588_10011148 [Phytophthora nicotianae]
MGNARSDTRNLASVHYLSISGDESNSTMYEEPLLDKSRQLQQEDDKIDLGAVIHQLNSFFAVIWPVSNAIICSSLAASYISDPVMTQAMKHRLIWLSTAEKTEEALLNALLVIVFIAFLTFGIVLLYKCNGMHLFAWYCMLYSAALLGLMGSKLVVIVLCGNLHWVIDRISLTIVMYNFAMVGVLSIFYQKGIPGILERGYLIATSVIVAWQLAQLPECQNQSDELARKFERNQLRLWRNLYTYYCVDYVSKQQPYPAIHTVFPTSMDTYPAYAGRPNYNYDTRGEGCEDKSIKLGLGDFIFYSVLVARASLHGFDVFAACFLSILVGLGITLYLLARFDALPALPISLFMGIITYLLMITITSPLLEELQARNVFGI